MVEFCDIRKFPDKPVVYFYTRCQNCDEKFAEFDPDKLDVELEKHFSEKHPKRFNVKMTMPPVLIARYNPNIIRKSMKYSERLQKDLR